VPGIDLAAYKRTLLERFGNPAIRDTVERVNTDAPLNVLLDPIRDRLRDGAGIELLALALAAWGRVSPASLRLSLRNFIRARDLLAGRFVKDGSPYEWRLK
jgi:mannitol-1-phosphate/altronate dehydrogenase